MIPEILLESKTVELSAMLNAREQRQIIQQKIQEKYPYPLISFTLNIVGAHKVFPLCIATFEYAVSAISTRCKAWNLPIMYQFQVREYTGYECFFSVNAPPIQVKKILCEMEEEVALGRLYDIDVITMEGKKISREDFDFQARKCLLCQEDAFVCARSRTHAVEDLWQYETNLMWDFFLNKYCEKVAFTATRALLYEVSATPKPGLVDQNNTGSHSDMDIHTFEGSALTLLPFFKEFVLAGVKFADHPCEALPQLFRQLRPLGLQAEFKMLEATDGVNTHKGIIFSMGIFLAMLGYLYGTQQTFSQEKLRVLIQTMVGELESDFHKINFDVPKSHGEKLYVEHGLRGIRGEALEGYPSLFYIALPSLEKYLRVGYSLNEAGVVTLLHILANTEDSNVIFRSDLQTMKKVQQEINIFLQNHEESLKETPDVALSFLEKLDKEFILQNISPGGSADLLALTYFFHFYQSEWGENYGF